MEKWKITPQTFWIRGCELVNLAKNKPTQQKSKAYGGKSKKAVDGNKDGDYKNGSVTHTKFEIQPWWEVDLEQVAEIDNVVLWNRSDCCKHRLNYFFVIVSEEPIKSGHLYDALKQPGVEYFYHEGFVEESIVIPIQKQGRYVRVQLAGFGFLSLAEVEVNACSEKPRRVRELLEFNATKDGQEVQLNWISQHRL